MISAAICAFLLAAASGYAIVIYNGLIRLRNDVRLAWSNIDVLLVQRHEEIPKLIEVCKGYMHHERQTLESVAQARSKVEGARTARNVPAVATAETALRNGLSGLYAMAEGYPDLKANDLFSNLQNRISALETAIADRREIYNDAVNSQNIRLEAFPDLLIAGLCTFHTASFLQFSDDQKRDVDLKPTFEP